MADRSVKELLVELEYLEGRNDIRKLYFNLEGNIGGFMYHSRRGIYYIIINQNLSFEAQTRVAYHEAKHVLDCEVHGIYICEFNNDNYDIHETNADDFAKNAILLKLVSSFL